MAPLAEVGLLPDAFAAAIRGEDMVAILFPEGIVQP
jgi:hypothetical protein